MILGIPYFSQLNQQLANLCGQACVCSLIHVLTPNRPGSARQVAIDTHTGDGSYSTAGELLNIGKHYGLTLEYTYQATVDWYRQQLANGIAPIALVNYGVLNPVHNFNGSHWCLVVGCTDDTIFIHDPLRPPGYTSVAIQQFDDAINSLTPLANPNHFAIYPEKALLMPTLTGVNIEPRHHASPPAAQLHGLDYVRFPIIIKEAYETGRETAAEALAIYEPVIRAYHAAGIKAMLPLTHQIGLEGQGFNFENMSAADWQRFTDMYLERTRVIVERLKGLGITYQVMNEQDSTDPRASVIVPPVFYGTLFNAAYALIKSIDSGAKVITGGYNSGADRGREQFKAANIIKTDGVAFHPYGASANGMYQNTDTHTLQVQITKWQTLGLPLYISEWGALGFASEPVDKMAQFISAFVSYCSGRVAAAVYFAWFAQDSHPYNSYPVINPDNSIRQPIFKALTGEQVTPPEPAGLQAYVIGASTVRARALPDASSTYLGDVSTGLAFNTLLEVRNIAPHTWLKVNGSMGGTVRDYWFAGKGPTWHVDVR